MAVASSLMYTTIVTSSLNSMAKNSLNYFMAVSSLKYSMALASLSIIWLLIHSCIFYGCKLT